LITTKIYRAVGLWTVLILLVSTNLLGQRKKKGNEEVHASGIRLREAEFYFTEGEKFFILEDYAKAWQYYQKTLEITPENATVHYKIAEVLSRSNKQDDLLRASLSIENALRLEKKNKYFYLLAANIYTSITRFDKAAQVYEELIEEVKGSEEYLYELAAVYQYANRYEDAIKTYNRAEAILGINEVSSLQKQRLYLEQGKVKDAVIEGEKLINAFPGEERHIMAFTEILSQKGMRPEAIQYLEKFIAQNPDANMAKMLLAGMYRDNKEEQKARPLLLTLFDDASVDLNSKLIILGAYNTELNQAKARNVAETEKESFALALFHKLEKTNPNDVNVHIVGGDLFLSTGKSREAQREYLKAVETGEVNFEVWENLLYLEVQTEQFEQAIKHSEQALELFPNQGMLYYFNGFANIRKHNFDEGIHALEQARKLMTSNPSFANEINTLLGDAYHATKQYDKSDKAFEDVLANNPNNDVALNNYSYYLALRKYNLEKAEKMSAQLTKDNPENATYLDTYAWVLYTRGKYKEAKKVIERAISTGNATATHFEHYGDILFKSGNEDAAVQQWEKARSMNANNEMLNKKIANRKIYE
jgi:tetratricopeptide (TPR) repeat protein